MSSLRSAHSIVVSPTRLPFRSPSSTPPLTEPPCMLPDEGDSPAAMQLAARADNRARDAPPRRPSVAVRRRRRSALCPPPAPCAERPAVCAARLSSAWCRQVADWPGGDAISGRSEHTERRAAAAAAGSHSTSPVPPPSHPTACAPKCQHCRMSRQSVHIF